MGRFLRVRLLSLLATLGLVSLVGFGITAYPPTDIPYALCHADFGGQQSLQACIQRRAHELGYDRPLFYFEIASLAEPDTLYRIYPFALRKSLRRMAIRSGNWSAINQWRQSVSDVRVAIDTLTHFPQATRKLQEINQVLDVWETSLSPADFEASRLHLHQLGLEADLPPEVVSRIQRACTEAERVRNTAPNWRTWVPRPIWHGTKCRYHQWLVALVQGDWGQTLNYRAVKPEVMRMITRSAPLMVAGTLISLVLGTWLGVAAARRAGSRFDQLTTAGVLALDAVPVFWAGILLLVLFANPGGLHLFPVTFDAIRPRPGHNVLRWVLPLIAYSYGGIAMVARLIRMQVLEALSQDFVRTARAKGLTANQVVWRHAFRQAWMPLATLAAGLLPTVVGGSLVLEHLFTIHGIGEGMGKAAQDGDTSFLLAVLTITGLLTALGYLLADLLYVLLDPRVRLPQHQPLP